LTLDHPTSGVVAGLTSGDQPLDTVFAIDEADFTDMSAEVSVA
jgi:hypothetical protein